LANNTTGEKNTASGHLALLGNTSGNGNTASGFAALETNTTGITNTAIGALADVTSGDLENATAIGHGAAVDRSNKVRIGNTSVTVIEGQVGLTITSDARLKEDITVVDAGLALVNDLNPVRYHRINSDSDDIEMGLLAQEVEEVLATHGLSNSGMVHQASEDAYRSVRYNDLLAPMIRAIQELDDAAEAKDQQIASLQEQLTEQQGSLLSMIAAQQEQIVQLQSMVNQQFATR
ncbi:tail fiber domain-containing protein, partial [Luminiphilus sp.]|nr:tail fiber domain-containing protein [Luminiphilus sp.]